MGKRKRRKTTKDGWPIGLGRRRPKAKPRGGDHPEALRARQMLQDIQPWSSKPDRLAPLDPEGECWLWPWRTDASGYGIVKTAKWGGRAHREAYKRAFGDIPSDVQVCHACDVRACFYPGHLWPGSAEDNMLDMWKKGRGPNAPVILSTWPELDEPPAWTP